MILIFLNMNHPHNFVVVGDNSKTPARFSTQLQPIKLDQNVGMAINSIFHGSIHNITSENQHVTYEVDIFKIWGGQPIYAKLAISTPKISK